jgi:hypothetical protein
MGPSPTILEGEAGATRRARGRAGPCALRCRRKPRSRTPPPFGKAARAGAPGGLAAGRGIVSHIAGNAASAVRLKNGGMEGCRTPAVLAAILCASSNAVRRSM